MKKYLLTLLTAGITFAASAGNVATRLPAYDESAYDQVLTNYFHQQKTHQFKNNLETASRFFLGKPYELGALGEGRHGEFDQHPLYRTDAFDCLTYVATVLAMAHSHSLPEFKRTLKKINYRAGIVDYVHRNHFTSVDWNPNALQLGVLKSDFTPKILDAFAKPANELADTVINKPNWYRFKKADALALRRALSPEQTTVLLNKLHALSKHVQPVRARMLYIPLRHFFINARKPNPDLFTQIPNGSVIEIVRPSWDLESKIGTKLHVSHMGFVFKTKQGLIFREASSVKNAVIDVPLADYLKPYLESPSVKGVAVFTTY